MWGIPIVSINYAGNDLLNNWGCLATMQVQHV